MLVADEMDRIGVRRNQIIESYLYYELCRDFEAMVFDWLADEYVGQRCQAGLIVKRPDLLPSIVALCRSYIRQDDENKARLKLKDEETNVNIKYGKWGFWISIVALCVSIAAVAIEYMKWKE